MAEEAKGQEEDVKETAETSQAEESKTDEYDIEDLTGNLDKKIPYGVFKERNEKLREAERRLKELESGMDAKIEEEVLRRVTNYQAAQAPAPASDFGYSEPVADSYGYDYDPTSQKVSVLEKQLSEMKHKFQTYTEQAEHRALQQQLGELHQMYPYMNREHVLSIKKMRPNVGIEEIAEYSHKQGKAHAEGLYKNYIEAKKKDAEKKVLSPSEFFSAPDKKPKSLKEAHKLLRQYVQTQS